MNLTRFLSLSLAATFCIAFAPELQAQDEQVKLRIVDQDGQPVDVRNLKFKGQQDADPDIQAGHGKIVIVDENGEKREIDVSGAQSIIVNKSVSSIIQDGEEEKQVSGKAIIIGPDGQRQEIELGDELLGDGIARFEWAPLDGMPGELRFHRFAEDFKYAIGVHCRTVSPTLRAHIDLEDGVGLVVTNDPVADSPAAQAGIQKHDILTYADQTQLSSTSDLAAAVQAAGAESQPLSITLQRKGKEIGVNVTPVERKSLGPAFGLFKPGFDFDVQLEEFGPGLILGDGAFGEGKDVMLEDLMKRMEELDIQFQQRMDDFKLLRDEMNNALKNREDDDK